MRLWKDRQLQISVTPLGLQVLAALLLLGLLGLHTGNNLLLAIFSLLAGLLLVSGWASMRALQHLAPEELEEAGPLFARARGSLRLRLREGAPRRPRALELHLELEGARHEAAFYPGGEGDPSPGLRLHVQPERRGPFRARALELRTRHPFGLLEKRRRFALDRGFLAAPHPKPTPFPAGLPEGQRRHTRPGDEAPVGARPFRPGDPVTRVHWKRTAQRGLPWVRTFEDDRAEGLRLGLDLRDWQEGPAFERALERLSGQVMQARLRRSPVVLELQGRGGSRAWEGPAACWQALALAKAEGAAERVDFSGGSPPPEDAID